ncbi:SAM-dependent methyltransferase [Xanthobacteraceae bacterium A53D]
MSGFSAEWLALREPADLKARDATLARDLAGRLAGHGEPRIIDLGCGTGSNLRATAPLLGPRQHWHLFDYDPALLAEAARALKAWAEDARPEGDDLVLARAGQTIRVSFRQADLASDPGVIGKASPDLVTASAFFDLVSDRWITRFVDVVAASRALFFTVLTCDGRDDWQPPHAADAAVAAAFRSHQVRDKGFGPAAGNEATDLLAHAFHAHGYASRTGDSPWLLEAETDGPLIAALATGTADAAGETGLVPSARLEGWHTAHLAARQCRIGHLDLLAWPKAEPDQRPLPGSMRDSTPSRRTKP